MPSGRSEDRRAAVEVWTRKPSGSGAAETSSSSASYLESLLADSAGRAPWLEQALGISSSGGKRILDVGCGPGLELCRMATAGADVTGVDLVPIHVEQAQAHLAQLGLRGEVTVADAEALPFPDGGFDRVISSNALQFTSSPTGAMAEIRRVLRPGGEARIVVYHRDSIYFWWRLVVRAGLVRGELLRDRSIGALLARNMPWNVDNTDLPVHVYSRVGLRRLMGRLGYVGVRTEVRDAEPVDSAGGRGSRAGVLRSRGQRWVKRHTGWYLVARGFRPPRR